MRGKNTLRITFMFHSFFNEIIIVIYIFEGMSKVMSFSLVYELLPAHARYDSLKTLNQVSIEDAVKLTTQTRLSFPLSLIICVHALS